MAKKKTKKASKKAVKKKAGATKSKAGKPAKKTAKKTASKAPARKKAPTKKAVKAKKKTGASVKAGATPGKAVKKKQIVGEGDYAATRAFDRDQAGFVQKNKAKIPALAKAAEAALDGPEGDALREAEATAAARSRDTF